MCSATVKCGSYIRGVPQPLIEGFNSSIIKEEICSSPLFYIIGVICFDKVL